MTAIYQARVAEALGSVKAIAIEQSQSLLMRSPSVVVRLSILAASAVGVFLAAEFVRVLPYGRAFWDFLFITEGAYRARLGQVPHVDFISPIGPLVIYLTSVAEWLFPKGQPFIGLHALMWLLLLPATALLAGKFATGSRFYAALFLLGLIVLVPYTVDNTSLSSISYFAPYNRFASAILFLLGLWYVLPKSRWDGVLICYLICLAFFLKITAAGVGLGLVMTACLLGRATWAHVVLSILGLVVICLLIQAESGLVSAYLHDVLAMTEVNRGQGLFRVAVAGFHNWPPLVVCTGILVLAIAAAKPRGLGLLTLPRSQPFAVDAVVLVVVSLLAESQNTGGVGLVAASAVLFRNDIGSQNPSQLVGTTLLGATLLLPILDVSVYRSVDMIVRERNGTTEHPFSALAPGIRVSTATLSGATLFAQLLGELQPEVSRVERDRFYLLNDPHYTEPAAIVAWLQYVVDAAARFKDQGLHAYARRYAVLSFTDPFSQLLGLVPARHVALVMQLGRTLPVFTSQAASQYLDDSDGVFVGKCEFPVGEEPSIWEVFRMTLEAGFERHPLNACWDFYSRANRNP